MFEGSIWYEIQPKFKYSDAVLPPHIYKQNGSKWKDLEVHSIEAIANLI